jgi:hypothetical protein
MSVLVEEALSCLDDPVHLRLVLEPLVLIEAQPDAQGKGSPLPPVNDPVEGAFEGLPVEPANQLSVLRSEH